MKVVHLRLCRKNWFLIPETLGLSFGRLLVQIEGIENGDIP
jgi:hypothetical protein